jgi:hypothetical protein
MLSLRKILNISNMTEEEKRLLIIDLSGRVPYGVLVEQTLFSESLAEPIQRLKSVQTNNCVKLYWYKFIEEYVPVHCVKPYLRRMSSMTESEQTEFNELMHGVEERCINAYGKGGYTLAFTKLNDWLNEHHFDYRGLIDKGLANEALADMYKF